MSKFYGQISSNTSAAQTRTGTKYVKASVQSRQGSVITSLYSDDNGIVRVIVDLSEESSSFGSQIFSGTFAEFKKKLGA